VAMVAMRAMSDEILLVAWLWDEKHNSRSKNSKAVENVSFYSATVSKRPRQNVVQWFQSFKCAKNSHQSKI
jgi:hypothetical protein